MNVDLRDVENARNKWVSLESKALEVGASEDLLDRSTNAKVHFLELDRDYWKGLYHDLKRKCVCGPEKKVRKSGPKPFAGVRNKKKPVLRLKAFEKFTAEERKMAEKLLEDNPRNQDNSKPDTPDGIGARQTGAENAGVIEKPVAVDDNRRAFRYSIVERIRQQDTSNNGHTGKNRSDGDVPGGGEGSGTRSKSGGEKGRNADNTLPEVEK